VTVTYVILEESHAWNPAEGWTRGLVIVRDDPEGLERAKTWLHQHGYLLGDVDDALKRASRVTIERAEL
jgi:hypothetical protein